MSDDTDTPEEPRGSTWFERSWRPTCGYMFAGILLRTIIVPLVQLYRDQPVEHLEWVPMAALAGLLVAARSYDKKEGTA